MMGTSPGRAPGIPPGSADQGIASLAHARAYALLALAIGAGYVVAVMLWPFLPAIVTSATIAVLAYPVFRRTRDRFRHPAGAALLTTILIFFLVLVPAIGMALLLLEQMRLGIDWMAGGSGQMFSPVATALEWIVGMAQRFGFDSTQLNAALSEQTRNLVSLLVERTLSLFTGLGGWILQAGVSLFTLHYLLRDGHLLLARIRWLLPLPPDLSDRLFRQAYEVTHATIYGNVLVAIVQGALGGLIFWVLGIGSPVVWGTVMGLLSVLPAVGAFLVWMPAAVVLLATGHVVKGVLLLAFGTFLISTVDNVLRAIFVGDRAEMHPLIVFFSVLGGLLVFGAVGVFVGPVLFVISLTLIEVARRSLDPSPASPTTAERHVAPIVADAGAETKGRASQLVL